MANPAFWKGGERVDAINRGFLNEDYRLFHSVDKRDADFGLHFHEFHKVVVCLRGSVLYSVEGRTLRLSAGDLLTIPRHLIHRSLFSAEEGYERMILWISTEFIDGYEEPALNSLFEKNEMRCLRPDPRNAQMLTRLLQEMEKTDGLLNRTYLLQFLLYLSKDLEQEGEVRGGSKNELTERVLSYVNDHLSEKLSVPQIAQANFVSPSYLMHVFRRETGSSVYRYVTEKRLIRAHEDILSGLPVLFSAQKNGFEDYSSFLKAYKKIYGMPPGQAAFRKRQGS